MRTPRAEAIHEVAVDFTMQCASYLISGNYVHIGNSQPALSGIEVWDCYELCG
jgi:hypothetical protein